MPSIKFPRLIASCMIAAGLAANISIGRNMAGVHFYTDYYDSLRMGERLIAADVPTIGQAKGKGMRGGRGADGLCAEGCEHLGRSHIPCIGKDERIARGVKIAKAHFDNTFLAVADLSLVGFARLRVKCPA